MNNRDGYVLIYVLVVMLILGVVAGGVLAAASNNSTSELAAIKKMQDRYKVEGQLNQTIAQLEAKTQSFTPEQLFLETTPLFSNDDYHNAYRYEEVIKHVISFVKTDLSEVLGVEEEQINVERDIVDSENYAVLFYIRKTNNYSIIIDAHIKATPSFCEPKLITIVPPENPMGFYEEYVRYVTGIKCSVVSFEVNDWATGVPDDGE